jgi:hypothetical protein
MGTRASTAPGLIVVGLAYLVTGSAFGGSAGVTTPTTAAKKTVIVRPLAPGPRTVVVVAWRVPEPMDNNADGYHITFHGPGRPDCSQTVTYGVGVSWNVRYNHRYEHRRAKVGFPPQRTAEGSGAPGAMQTWCIGKYEGRVVFEDWPRGDRHGEHHTSRSCSQRQLDSGRCVPKNRLVGRFSFSIS